MKFEVINHDPGTSARTGRMKTAHGAIETPVFMPVGTAGAIKAVDMRSMKDDVKAQIILGNTYHLFLRPGIDIINRAGGLHKFNTWDGPILTDSGGYQVYSLSAVRKVTKNGVTFRSHIDGSKHLFTPESAIDIQRKIGADIIMAFDECTPYPCDYDYAKNSMHLTHQWLGRCMQRFEETDPEYDYEQALFPIVQGSVYKDLREQSAYEIAGYDTPGNAIGGLAVGEPAEEMYAITEMVCNILPSDKPRYLMGVGTPVNLLEAISLGVDMFDCVMPTRNARNGMLFTRHGTMNMRNEKWKDDFNAIDTGGPSYVDERYSRAFLRHLFIAGEMLGGMIASIHNLAFYQWLMKEARQKIAEGSFEAWKISMVKNLDVRL